MSRYRDSHGYPSGGAIVAHHQASVDQNTGSRCTRRREVAPALAGAGPCARPANPVMEVYAVRRVVGGPEAVGRRRTRAIIAPASARVADIQPTRASPVVTEPWTTTPTTATANRLARRDTALFTPEARPAWRSST